MPFVFPHTHTHTHTHTGIPAAGGPPLLSGRYAETPVPSTGTYRFLLVYLRANCFKTLGFRRVVPIISPKTKRRLTARTRFWTGLFARMRKSTFPPTQHTHTCEHPHTHTHTPVRSGPASHDLRRAAGGYQGLQSAYQRCVCGRAYAHVVSISVWVCICVRARACVPHANNNTRKCARTHQVHEHPHTDRH